jgi:hypothetical protein
VPVTLHAPRSRTRSIAAATLGALALVGSLLVATPAQALNDTGTGGVFTPATGRILDTAKGIGGFSTPMEAGKYRTIKVAGLAGIPDDGSVGAVSLNATVGTAPGYGTLFGRPDADTSRTSMLIYNGNTGEYVSNTATVAVGGDGTIQIMAETSARVILDVQGYYTANTDGTAAGGFVPVAGKRFVDTRSGLGAPKATIAPGKSVDVQVTGTNDVPAGASGAVVNLVAINSSSSDGNLTPFATSSTEPQNSLHYTPSATTSMQAQVALSADGKMTIANSSSTINLVIDLQGYFTAAGKSGASFTPGTGRAYDSRATGNTALAKNETRSIQVAGTAGVPVMGSGITAVVLTLIVSHGGSDGRATVWADGATKPDTTSINFQADEIRTNTVTVPLGVNGKISLNNVADPTNYVIDVQGWYTNPVAPKISCPSPYTSGSWFASVPADDVDCTVIVPAATHKGQTIPVLLNGAPVDDLELADDTQSVDEYIPAQPGMQLLAIGDGDAQSTYSIGFGDWASNPLISTPNSGSTTGMTPELFVSSDGDLIDPGATVRYGVYTSPTASGSPVWTTTASPEEAVTVPTGALSDKTTYYWTATISGASGGVQGATKATSVSSFSTDAQPDKSDVVFTISASTGQELGDIIDDAAASQGANVVANGLQQLASEASAGNDVNFTPLSDLSAADQATALQAEADRLKGDPSSAQSADNGTSAGTDSGTESTTAQARVKSSWDTHVVPSPQRGAPVRNKRTWIAHQTAISEDCGTFGCDLVDEYTATVIFDPNQRYSRLQVGVLRNIAEENILQGVDVEARVYGNRTEYGHLTRRYVGRSGNHGYTITLAHALAGGDVTLWAEIPGNSAARSNPGFHSRTTSCSKRCKW